jgi:F-type H+-transporting ATPase subunit b
MGVRVSRNLAVIALLSALLLLASGPSIAWAQAEPPPHATTAQPAPESGQASPTSAGPAAVQGARPDAHDSGGLVPTIARLVNFGLLAGALVYFLRSPAATYLRGRKEQIRSDLVKAQEMRTAAAAQIAEIEQRMTSLPAELDALRSSGAEEVVAEEARIRQAANAERSRFLEQARREIDAQLKLAERALVKHAAGLAVAIAAERIKTTITAADQTRLVDRYLTEVGRSSVMPS